MHRGFSLVELSIVLVILGLLVGGVLSGQALIKAAQIRAITTEFSKYRTASLTFRDKYFALAGDMPNATAFWGIAGGTGSDATCGNTVSTDAKTCNGDGDGDLTYTVSSSYSIAEPLRFWQHLANAGLIEGQYPGTGYYPAKTRPDSKFSNFSWSQLSKSAGGAGDTSNFARPAANVGLAFTRRDGCTQCMVPEDAWQIDKKMDDGRPQSGSVLSLKGWSSYPCATTYGQPTSADAAAEYNVSYTNGACDLEFPNTL